MGIIRNSVTMVAATAILASSSVVASATIRPSDSLVSAPAAAKSSPLVGRQGASVKDANHLSTAALILILLGLAAAGYGLEQALSESP
jgi:hypothetical protein